MEERLSLENRVNELSRQLEALTRRVDQLSGRLEAAPSVKTVVAEEETYDLDDGDASEAFLSWIGKSALLQRLSTLCFLLVIALILRTLTDSELIDQQIGSLIGMAYAASLMLLGWGRYKRHNPLAPIYTICGTVLMFLVVVEAHTHFNSLPSLPAYILLVLTGFGMASLSYFFQVPAPISIGTLGMCLAGAAIDYPQPYFPYLGVVLLTANILGYFAARAHKFSWLRWIMLPVTMFMIITWGVKLGTILLGKEPMPHILAPSFFLPLLGLFALTYPLTAYLRIRRKTAGGKLAKFDLIAPSISATWAFLLAQYVTFAMGDSVLFIGCIGIAAGLAHLGLAWRLANRKGSGAPGANAFIFAGSLLLALAIPVVTGGILPSLPFLAALALCLSRFSEIWQSGAVRLSSYLLQLYAAAALAFLLTTSPPDAHAFTGILIAALLTGIGLFHYKRCRTQPPPATSSFFARWDSGDLSAVLLLLAALGSAFFLLRSVSYQLLMLTLPADALGDPFRCAQSVIINAAAAVLMLFALANKKKELRNIAVMITIIGAVKVFLYDLIGGMQGLPLVISVFSFGITTGLESFGLTRWHHYTGTDKTEERDADVPR